MDYVLPPLHTAAAPWEFTKTMPPTLLADALSTQTAQPIVPTPTTFRASATPIPSSTLSGLPTLVFYQSAITPSAGDGSADEEANVMLKSQLTEEAVVKLEGVQTHTCYLTAKESHRFSLPAGTYAYWITIPGEGTWRGEKVFEAGFSEWVLTMNDDLQSTSTPQWPTKTMPASPDDD